MPPKSSKKEESSDKSKLRIAIVDEDKCKPKKCNLECKKNCPVNRTGKFCIEVENKVAKIAEILCIGCGICVKKCPFEAITIINLPKDLSTETTHRFGPNTFKLHRLPVPKPGHVLGLVGTNGIGKSTALKILAGKLKPNLGRFDQEPPWQAVVHHFRGSELQGYFTRILEEKLKASIKPQYVDTIPKSVSGLVEELIIRKDEKSERAHFMAQLELNHIKSRPLKELSGGELQRFAICIVCLADCNVYMFDEPSSFLDVHQRMKAAQVIRSIVRHDNFVIVVEHDLSVLDYLSDSVCCLWGCPSVYGVVTTPFSVREGINIFLDGFIPTENLRFRESGLSFKVSETQEEEEVKRIHSTTYPKMSICMGGQFKLTVEEGNFSDSEIIVMLGQNGTGKSTLIRMLAGLLKPDESDYELPTLFVSHKPQQVSPKYEGRVRDLFLEKIRDSFVHPQFNTDVVKPMCVDHIMDQQVQVLSGGELQRVALIVALGKPADIYLIDEPSAYLDSEQRIQAAKVIKRYILHAKKTAFVVEHDFIMSTYLADRVIVYSGNPGIDCVAGSPESLITGMNKFLTVLEITFRRDPTNFRPRINKLNSIKDKDQKSSGQYFVVEDN